MKEPLTDAMLEYIQEIEYQWYEESMNPDFFDEVTEFEEMEGYK